MNTPSRIKYQSRKCGLHPLCIQRDMWDSRTAEEILVLYYMLQRISCVWQSHFFHICWLHCWMELPLRVGITHTLQMHSGYPSTADETCYWSKCILHRGLQFDMVHWLFMNTTLCVIQHFEQVMSSTYAMKKDYQIYLYLYVIWISWILFVQLPSLQQHQWNS